MSQILTWTEFLAKLKIEANVNDASLDTFFLDCANDVLTEICANTENLRDLRFDVSVDVDVGFAILTDTYIREIEQVYYVIYAEGSPSRRYDITEDNGLVGPSPIEGKPDSYSLLNTTTDATPTFTFNFSPMGSGTVGDKIQVIGTGFRYIADAGDYLPWVAFYPMIQRSVLQRLQIKRGKKVDDTEVWKDPIVRAATGASVGSKDDANSTAQEPKPRS